jgi:hypothetical protein
MPTIYRYRELRCKPRHYWAVANVRLAPIPMLWHSLVTNALRRQFWGCYGYIAFNDAKPGDITVGYGIMAWWLHSVCVVPASILTHQLYKIYMTNVVYTVTPQPVNNLWITF